MSRASKSVSNRRGAGRGRQVVNDPASDFETVTTTTSRPVMRRVPSSSGDTSPAGPRPAAADAHPPQPSPAGLAPRLRNSPHALPGGAPAMPSPVLGVHPGGGPRASPFPSPQLPPARPSPRAQAMRAAQFPALDPAAAAVGSADGVTFAFAPFPPRASPHLSPSLPGPGHLQLSPPAAAAAAYSPPLYGAGRQPAGPGRPSPPPVYALSAFDPFGRSSPAAAAAGPGGHSPPLAASPAGYTFDLMVGRPAGPSPQSNQAASGQSPPSLPHNHGRGGGQGPRLRQPPC